MREIPKHGFPMEYRGLPCFRDLNVQEVRRVWALGEQVHIPSGWSLMLERGVEDNVHLLLSGTMLVNLSDGDSSLRGPGELLGSLDSTREPLRTAVMTATADVEALLFPVAAFRTACTEVPAFAEAIRRTESSRAV